MDTARDYAGALLRPLTFMGSQTKRVLLTPLMHSARPFRVSNHDRSSRRGVMANSLKELLSKTLEALVITSGLVNLVLEEDGTVVDTEEFFQTLEDNTHFMILEKGQKWTPGGNYVSALQQPKKAGIARVTFDLYKLNPKDVIGCLNVKATMYEMYSVSYDIRCTGVTLQTGGHVQMRRQAAGTRAALDPNIPSRMMILKMLYVLNHTHLYSAGHLGSGVAPRGRRRS
uniref:Lipid transferase CIDEA n=1 Tax=Callorhinus ursinus TaxID=34884 RepID=A0A3Q7NRL8_CALUR|nr:cell death activator CIDE-A isoform X1 [Callorhinus ursinus]